jgi:hypothetical protein
MSVEPSRRRVSIGPVIAAIGALLVIVSLFLDWYDGISGFTVFEFLDLLLVLLALYTIAQLAGDLGLLQRPRPAGVNLAVAIFTVLVVGSQLINDPPAVANSSVADKDVGIWLALAGSALMVAGALLAYARISLSVEARER